MRNKLIAATSAEELAAVAAAALQSKLALVLGLQVEEVDSDKPFYQYGMDSIIALEIQSWIRREVDAEIAICEVLGEATVCSLSKAIMAKIKGASL